LEEGPDPLPCCLDGSLVGFSEQRLELGEHLLDRVEIGAVRRQEQEMCPDLADRLADGFALVAAQIVEDDDIAGRQRRE